MVIIKMFSRFYIKDNRGYYIYPLYNYPFIWFLICLGVALITRLLNKLVFNPFLDYLFWISVVGALMLGFIGIYILVRGIKVNDSLVNYFDSLRLEASIRKALLNTMNLNRYKDSPVIEVPRIKVVFQGMQIKAVIYKLPGMYDIDKLQEDVNASFTGKFSKFAIISSFASDDGTKFSFILEDVGTDKTFIPKTINDLVQKPYFLGLQKGLKINISKLPHLAIWGQSGSGKTTVLMSLIAQCLSNNTDLLFLDGKTEFSSFSAFYPVEKIATNNDDVLTLLQHVSETIKKRQKIIANAVKKRNKLGLTGYELGLQPIIIIGDEIGSIVAGMNTKEKKEFIALLTQVVQKGRSVSVFAILASQSPSVDVLPQGIRAQFSTKILLGSANTDIQRMAFGEATTPGNVEKFQGYYSIDGLTIDPQKFFVPNLFKYDLENMQIFKQLYEIGKRKE